VKPQGKEANDLSVINTVSFADDIAEEMLSNQDLKTIKKLKV
jgi:hypothetical protein